MNDETESTVRRLHKPARQGAELTREELVTYTNETGGGGDRGDDDDNQH